MDRANLESLFQRQTQTSEAILLTYDPSCATRGQLGMKGYRLSKLIFNAMLENEKRMQLSNNTKVSS